MYVYRGCPQWAQLFEDPELAEAEAIRFGQAEVNPEYDELVVFKPGREGDVLFSYCSWVEDQQT